MLIHFCFISSPYDSSLAPLYAAHILFPPSLPPVLVVDESYDGLQQSTSFSKEWVVEAHDSHLKDTLLLTDSSPPRPHTSFFVFCSELSRLCCQAYLWPNRLHRLSLMSSRKNAACECVDQKIISLGSSRGAPRGVRVSIFLCCYTLQQQPGRSLPALTHLCPHQGHTMLRCDNRCQRHTVSIATMLGTASPSRC